MADDNLENASRRKFIMGAGAAGIGLAAGCTQTNDGGSSDGGDGGDGGSNTLSGSITITGSSTVFPLATAVQEKFEGQHDQVKIDVSSTGSGGGFSNHFCPGKSDINNASRPIKKEEKQLCKDNGVEWHEINVATDALTVIVNNENDWATELTVEELKQIWSPETKPTKWSDVNSDWPDKEFDLYGAASTSGTFDYFTEVIVGEEGKSRKDYSATEKDRTIVRGVQNNKYAMGYLGFAYYSENTDAVTAVAIDNGDGPVKPSLETAKSGEYKPLARPLFTYPAMDALKKDHIAEFCRFFTKQSANRDLVANKVGYVPNTEEDMQAELEDLNAAIKQANGN